MVPSAHPLGGLFPAGVATITPRVVVLSGGERVRVLESGEPQGSPVLLLHGWAASSFFYRKLIAPLAADGRRVLAPDLRGHGLSDKPLVPEVLRARSMVEFVVAVMDALAVREAVVVGHSMGGAVALDAALVAPERVRGLLLLAPVGLSRVWRAEVARLVTPAGEWPRSVPSWVVPWVLRRMHGEVGSISPTDIAEYRAPLQIPGFARAMRLLVREYDWAPRAHERLAGLRLPVRVVLGGRDRLIDLAGARGRVRFIPGATVRVAPRAGHVVGEEASEIVLEELRALMEECR